MMITIHELRNICMVLLNYLDEVNKNNEALEFHTDYYWFLRPDVKYDLIQKPTQSDIQLGEFSFEWSSLVEIINEPSDIIGYHFIWLGQVFQYIGQELL